MEAEKANIGRAAHEYEEVLRKYLDLDDRGFPRFHLILLGMGTEGHTASLFPGTRVTRQTSRWVSTPMVAKLNTRRMTLTLPVLDAAMRVVFLVVGSGESGNPARRLGGQSLIRPIPPNSSSRGTMD